MGEQQDGRDEQAAAGAEAGCHDSCRMSTASRLGDTSPLAVPLPPPLCLAGRLSDIRLLAKSR